MVRSWPVVRVTAIAPPVQRWPLASGEVHRLLLGRPVRAPRHVVRLEAWGDALASRSVVCEGFGLGPEDRDEEEAPVVGPDTLVLVVTAPLSQGHAHEEQQQHEHEQFTRLVDEFPWMERLRRELRAAAGGEARALLVTGELGSCGRRAVEACARGSVVLFWFTPEDALCLLAMTPERRLCDVFQAASLVPNSVIVFDDMHASFPASGRTESWAVVMQLLELATWTSASQAKSHNNSTSPRPTLIGICTSVQDVSVHVVQGVFPEVANHLAFRSPMGLTEWETFWGNRLSALGERHHPHEDSGRARNLALLSGGFTLEEALSVLTRSATKGGSLEHHCSEMRRAIQSRNQANEKLPFTLVVPGRGSHSSSSDMHAFDRVGGQHEAKQCFREAVLWPKEKAEAMRRLNVPHIRGILLHGPPGTGKTLLATCAAEAAGCNFLTVSVPDLVRGDVGTSERRVAQLFAMAKKCAPCVVFFDEAQALFYDRGRLGPGGQKLVSQFLAETDGLVANDGILLLAATNELHTMDTAMVRPGRFDRVVYVGPCARVEDRCAVLREAFASTSQSQLFSAVDPMRVAGLMPSSFTGANIHAVCNRAMLRASTRSTTTGVVGEDDFLVAIGEEMAG